MKKIKKPKKKQKRPSAKKMRKIKLIILIAAILVPLAVVLFVLSGFSMLSSTSMPSTNVLSVSTSTTAPDSPTKLTASIKNSVVTLLWDDSSTVPADKYIVYRYDALSGQYVEAPANEVISSYSRKYVSGNNEAGKTYQYKVAGVRVITDANGSVQELVSALSSPVTVLMPSTTAPKTPSGLRATIKNSLISISWKGDADGYQVEKYDAIQKKYKTVYKHSSATVNKYSAQEFEPGLTYKFRLSAYNNLIKSGKITGTVPSGYAYFTAKMPKLSYPVEVSGIKPKIGSASVRLAWQNPATYSFNGIITYIKNSVDGYEIMFYNATSKTWSLLSENQYIFISDREVEIPNESIAGSKMLKIRSFKLTYSESTQKAKRVYSPYSSVRIP